MVAATMVITEKAEEKLTRMLQAAAPGAPGFRLEDIVGTCHGSTPVLKPVTQPAAADTRVHGNRITLFLPPAYADAMDQGTLDYDASFMGRGLTLTWPHTAQCPCNRRHT